MMKIWIVVAELVADLAKVLLDRWDKVRFKRQVRRGHQRRRK